MGAVSVHRPVDGSYNSAAPVAVLHAYEKWPAEGSVQPPAIKTFPFESKVALWPMRASFISPVLVQLCLAGSNNSAEGVTVVQER